MQAHNGAFKARTVDYSITDPDMAPSRPIEIFFSFENAAFNDPRHLYAFLRDHQRFDDHASTMLLRFIKRKKRKMNWYETLNVKKETINKAVNVGMGG